MTAGLEASSATSSRWAREVLPPAGGTVLDGTALARIHDLDLERGVVRADAGVSLDALIRALLPFGWFVHVTPGTRQVTLGGALAADVHGKSHHFDGSFANHVVSFTLHTPTGTVDVIFGTVVAIHINDEYMRTDGRLDVERIRPLARLGYHDYTSVESVFEMKPRGSPARLAGLEGSPEKMATATARLPT